MSPPPSPSRLSHLGVAAAVGVALSRDAVAHAGAVEVLARAAGRREGNRKSGARAAVSAAREEAGNERKSGERGTSKNPLPKRRRERLTSIHPRIRSPQGLFPGSTGSLQLSELPPTWESAPKPPKPPRPRTARWQPPSSSFPSCQTAAATTPRRKTRSTERRREAFPGLHASACVCVYADGDESGGGDAGHTAKMRRSRGCRRE